MLRGFEEETSCRDFARRLLRIHTKANYVNADDDFFDECILEALQYGHTDIEGVIAMYYDALVSNAELREQLKKYEDAEENGLLLPQLPCKVGDTVWVVNDGYLPNITKGEAVAVYRTDDGKDKTRSHVNVRIIMNRFTRRIRTAEFGKSVFLTREEAEQALEARDSKGECK